MTNVIQLPKSSTSTEPLPRNWIEKLFDKMLLSYGKKFTDQWMGADPNKLIAHWAEELASFTGDELKRGYMALEVRDWPPSLPEFKKMCRPPMDPTVAYYEAVNGLVERERGKVGTWTHPAIFWAAAGMAHDLKNLSHTAVKDRWEKALQDQMEKGQWELIPEVRVALPAPGKTKTDKAEAERMMAQYMKTVTKSNDHRRWIGNVLARAKSNDETLPGISVRMAKEALEAKAS